MHPLASSAGLARLGLRISMLVVLALTFVAIGQVRGGSDGVQGAAAQGRGNCFELIDIQGATKVAGGEDAVSGTAPSGQSITRVAVKAGRDCYYTAVGATGTVILSVGGTPCYRVTGLGTATVTVTRIGSGPICKGISHIELTRTVTPTVTPTVPPTVTPTPAAGTLKICKDLAAGTTAPAGTLFTFTVSGRTGVVSVTPGTCAELSNVPVGSTTVTETGPAGYAVSAIRTLAGSCTFNVPGGSAVCTIVANQETEVLFTNQVVNRYVQLCKETTDGLTGAFTFSSPAFASPQTINVVAGATQPVCGPLTQVTATSIAVTEATGAGFSLTGVRTVGPCSATLSGTTATVNVSGATTAPLQCLIIFRNVRSTGI